jgi:hypothetical protein
LERKKQNELRSKEMKKITLKEFIQMHLSNRVVTLDEESICPLTKVYICSAGEYELDFPLDEHLLDLDIEEPENFALNLENESVIKALSKVLYND